ncbi:glycosyl transferase [Leptospira gomenensis]|uniref:Glycosyl transferase n=1 Tax=Leptospira gomenensis TaxID=2484974 RepID=A0A5F1YEC3_9LEPT|nr:sugar transferase [Leptospira gomenensis]TGK35982.1 glycosyl transferase [Leptospira gomenensis]TGK39987.1 glycosyl transferase [Leptospira gomenensis]TGK51436.1 glycosyl transferase [Leptospira gomenensis]TGK64889.1 glycosyl transferase [Leptospira gomenensis]
MKRTMEFFSALAALALFAPLLVGICLTILIVDGRPVFFLQERIGIAKRKFKILKFRTMKDGVVTKLGRLLRLTGIDELPQIFNILTGDMSAVGPRPLTQFDLDRLGWNGTFYEFRWDVLPGITGLSQIYAGMGARVSLCFDRSYVKRRSLWIDLKIVLMTFAMNLVGKETIRKKLKTSLLKRKTGIRWNSWRLHFRKNENRPLPPITSENLKLNPNEMRSIAYSLAVFQLGESGEGRIAKEIDKAVLFGIDGFYKEALKLFVKEEGRHARILGECVRALKGDLLSSNWTERLFHFGRRLLGIRLKLMVLLAAEVVGICFYRRLADKIPEGFVKRALLEIVKDEEKHLKFHGDFFRIRMRTFLSKFLFRILWRTISFAACVTVILDHRKTFNTLGISNYKTFKKFREIAESAEEFIIEGLTWKLNRSFRS